MDNLDTQTEKARSSIVSVTIALERKLTISILISQRCDAQRPTCGPCARRKPPSPTDLADGKGPDRAKQQSQQWEPCCYDAEPTGRRKKQSPASRAIAQGGSSRGSIGSGGQRSGSGEEAKLAEMQNKIREFSLGYSSTETLQLTKTLVS
jgi:hypothetical protein